MDVTKNILFVSYDGMTDPLGQSQVIPYLAGLTRYGFRFTILSCEKPKPFMQHKNSIANLLKSHSIKWSPVLYHKKPPILSSVYDVRMLRKRAKELHAKEKFDMVHTRAGIPALIGLWMKKKLGIKFLHDVREFYADSRVDGGMWNLKNSLYKIVYNYFKRKEDQEVETCDGMVCLTYAAEKIIKQWPCYKNETILEVIPCGTDLNLFDPEKISPQEKSSLKNELTISESDFIISYLGSIGGWYLTDELMKFCKCISDRITSAKFLFISPHEKTIIFETAARFGISPEKIIAKNAQRYEVPLLLSLSNYSVFFIKPCYSKKSSSPTKHGEIMAMGIPLITNCGVGDVADIVQKYNSGILIEKMTEENYIECSGLLQTEIFDANKIREGAKEFYSLDQAIEKYAKVYNLILK